MVTKEAVFTLDKAIELGEYSPDFLERYPEWEKMSTHMQFEYIRQAIDNRRRHLRREYAAIFNQLDFSKKPQLQAALKKIQAAMKDLNQEEEELQIEYAGK